MTPGIYQHYKGDFYHVIGVGKHSETLEDLVFYEALSNNPRAALWVRPLAMFRQSVINHGKKVPRFAHQQPRRRATLCFLVKQSAGKTTHVCLALKKRGFGVGRWNGTGGKVRQGETVEQAMRREVQEEIHVMPTRYYQAAKLVFIFPHHHAYDQVVHVFVATAWQGKPAKSEEMKPRWFALRQLPLSDMWSDDSLWLPPVLAGECLKAVFVFDPHEKVAAHHVAVVSHRVLQPAAARGR